MKFREAFGEVAREQRLAQGMPMRVITEVGFISLGHLSEVERGHNDPSSETIDAIANGLGVKSYELILEAGLRMYRDSISDSEFTLPDNWHSQYDDLLTKQ